MVSINAKRWPVKPGPQAGNRIAATAAEQFARVFAPRQRCRPDAGRRAEAMERELAELRRLVGIALVRWGRG